MPVVSGTAAQPTFPGASLHSILGNSLETTSLDQQSENFLCKGDVTPPEVPTGIQWQERGNGRIKMVWSRLREWTYSCQGERRMGDGTVRDFGKVMYTLLYLKWITNKGLLYSTWNSAQCYVPAWMVGGGGVVWGRMDTRICLAEFLCYSPETATTLLVSYTPIQNIFAVKK